MKRGIDLIVSAAALVALSPILLAAAVAVRVTTGSPVLFRHQRVGRHGELFDVLKLRTMTSGAGPETTAATDPRITPIGRLLRRWKIDELPQLWNVTRGEMSLVGPRPEVARYVDMFSAEYDVLLATRPGITDPASLAFRHEQDLLAQASNAEELYVNEILPEKIRISSEYLANANVRSDLSVLLQTARGIAS